MAEYLVGQLGWWGWLVEMVVAKKPIVPSESGTCFIFVQIGLPISRIVATFSSSVFLFCLPLAGLVLGYCQRGSKDLEQI